MFFWALYIIFELLIYELAAGSAGSLWKNVVYYSLNIGIFYCQTWLLTMCFSDGRHLYGRFAAGAIAELTAFVCLKISADYYFTDFGMIRITIWQLVKSMGALDLFRCIQFAIASALYWTGRTMTAAQRKVAEAAKRELADSLYKTDLESKLAKAQNAYLQQQINPHLLLNSLNFVYSSVFIHSEAAADAVLLLADMMRFSLEGADEDGKIELAKEADQLNSLIRINQYRFDYPMSVAVTTAGNLSSHRIIPLVLLTLSENIFKHGDLKNKPAILSIAVSDDGLLTYRSSNYKRPRPAEGIRKRIGLENIRIRLDYAYNGSYELETIDDQDVYQTYLKIQL